MSTDCTPAGLDYCPDGSLGSAGSKFGAASRNREGGIKQQFGGGYQPQPQWQPQPPKPPRSGTVRIVVIVGCLVAVVGVVVVFTLLRPVFGSSASNQAVAGDGKVVARPGYPDATSGVADPAPLGEIPNPTPANYQGTPVVQACNLLSLADLHKLGIDTDANPLPNTVTFERTYIAADGAGPLHAGPSTKPSAKTFALNKCSYRLASRSGAGAEHVSVAVAQEPYYPGSSTIEKYPGAQKFGDVNVSSQLQDTSNPDDRQGEVSMWIHGAQVDLDVGLSPGGYGPKMHDIVTVIAANMQAQIAAPTGPGTISYDRAAFPAAVAQPCPLLTRDVFAAAYQGELSPLVVEQPATAVGQTTFDAESRDQNYVAMTCYRGAGELDPLERNAVELEIKSYLSEDAAKKDIAFVGKQHHGQPTDTPLGDESLVLDDQSMLGAAGAVTVRKGRFILDLRGHDPQHPDGRTAAEAQKMLVPAMQQVIRNLGDQQ